MNILINVGLTIFSNQIHLEPNFVYEMLRCLSTRGFRVQQEEGKNPKFVRGLRFNGGLLNFFFLINKNAECEKTKKGKV
jgi:hypothetical protein